MRRLLWAAALVPIISTGASAQVLSDRPDLGRQLELDQLSRSVQDSSRSADERIKALGRIQELQAEDAREGMDNLRRNQELLDMRRMLEDRR